MLTEKILTIVGTSTVLKVFMVINYGWRYFVDKETDTASCITLDGEFLEFSTEGLKGALSFLLLNYGGLRKDNALLPVTDCSLSVEDLFPRERFYFENDKKTDLKDRITPFYLTNNSNIILNAKASASYYKTLFDTGFFAHKNTSVYEAIAYCIKHITTLHNEDCLYTSLNQFGYLTALGFYPKLVIGGFFPIRKMHAWVLINEKVYMDDMEEIKHFYPLLEIRASNN